jgi:hypothetical protein
MKGDTGSKSESEAAKLEQAIAMSFETDGAGGRGL